MPPQFLFDLSKIDLNAVLFDQDAIRESNPHRGDMEMLNGVVWSDADAGEILGWKEVRDDEFWVSGHIPGRPLFPGVLMVETAAQLASVYIKRYIGWKGFVGFGGIENCKFRGQVQPGTRMLILAKIIWTRHRRICARTQGIINGALVFEADIIGVEL